MPQSDPYNIPWILEIVKRVNPTSILDVGIGNGTYGFLFRQSLDIGKGRLKKDTWKLEIDGIEIFENYRNPIWEYFYDRVFIGDVINFVDKLDYYDLIFLGDIIEHFDKATGMLLLKKLNRKAETIIVVTPRGEYPQGEVFENIKETHLSEWRETDFTSFPYESISLNVCHIFVISNSQPILQKINNFTIPRLIKPSKNVESIIKNLTGELLFEFTAFSRLIKRKFHLAK